MRTLLVLAITLMTLSSQAQAEDMQKYLSDTQDMVRQGKHKEALERFLWFHDHALEHERAMYGVRLSFALSYWKQLGDVYPPAKEAMVDTRDRKTKEIENGNGTVALFHDVTALNRTLGEESKTVALFRHLDQQQPELAKECWDVAKEPAIRAKQYDLAKKYVGNLVREFTRVRAMYEYSTTLYERKDIGRDHLKAWNENHFVEESLRLIEVAVALGDQKAAKEIQKKALALVDDHRLRDAIQTGKKDAQQENSPDKK